MLRIVIVILVISISLVYNYISLIHLGEKLIVQTSKINANGIEIGMMVITNWMSSYSTIDFLAVWEEIHNSDDFNRLEFQSVRNERGRLIMTPKQWIERMQAKGIISKAGKYGGT